MQIDDVFKDVSGDLSQLRAAVNELRLKEAAGNLSEFNAIFGTFGSTLFHVTEKVEKFHGGNDRWGFINSHLSVALCYEMGTRAKHGTLDQHYLRRRQPAMDEVLVSVGPAITGVIPAPTGGRSGSRPIATVGAPRKVVKYIALDKTRHRALDLAQDALSALEVWLAKHDVPFPK
jgi:hypothetical protein